MGAVAVAIAAGRGTGSVPGYAGSEYPELGKSLPGGAPPAVEAYFVYPEELRSSKRVAVFRDFLTSELGLRG